MTGEGGGRVTGSADYRSSIGDSDRIATAMAEARSVNGVGALQPMSGGGA